VRTVALPSGQKVPAFGMGTWMLGDHRAERAEEIAALRIGLDAGATLIDSAEMYGEGRSEDLVGEAIEGRRDTVFLVSKVLPHHAASRSLVASCEASLRRLGTDRIDLYLLHWRGRVPLAETVQAFVSLQRAGKIRHWGVSNFDLSDMEELWSLELGAGAATNQVLYNLSRRGVEWALAPRLFERHVPLMAYSPVDQGKLLRNAKLAGFARANGMTASQAALAWLLAKDDVIVIPRTGHRHRMRENLGALEYRLSTEQLAELDRLFPPPNGPRPLEML